MSNEIMKPEDAHALARRISNSIEHQVQGLVQEVNAKDQMTPYEMKEMFIRITGALEGIAQSQRQIQVLLEGQSATNLCR